MSKHWLIALLLLPCSGVLAVQYPDVEIIRLEQAAYAGKDLSQHHFSYRALMDARHQAQLGHVNSQFNVAVMYQLQGDLEQATYWYERASGRGHAIAAYNLGAIHYQGLGVPVNYETAAYWIRKSAERGFDRAQFEMGALYWKGRGVPQDPTQEAKWYLRAAQNGHAKAQYNLAVLYANGEGVELDRDKALHWLQEAGRNGFPVANAITQVESSLNDTEARRARELPADLAANAGG